MFGRRRRLSPEETQRSLDERLARSKAAMHCQCCSRDILANTGTIAHHGYQRPGWGWQTSSCFGAKRLPWEADRTALAEMIAFMRQRLASMRISYSQVKSEKQPCSFEYSYYEKGETKSRTKTVELTRKDFEAKKKEGLEVYLIRMSIYNFDTLLKNELTSMEYHIKNLTFDIRRAKSRYDGWVKTHHWDEKTETWKKEK